MTTHPFHDGLRRACGVLAAALAILASAPASADMGDDTIYGMFLVEQLEYGYNSRANPVSWDAMGWVGGDWNRLWFKTEGETSTDALEVEGEAQLLYSRLIGAYWEFQVGLRGDLIASEDGRHGRGHLSIGLEGVAPYWFELAPTIFVSHEGDVSFRVHASIDLYITQRLLVEPSAEINAAIQAVPEFGVGAGFNDFELGLRLRYELAREFAPYIGVNWRQSFGETADLVRAKGGAATDVQAVIGVRFWL